MPVDVLSRHMPEALLEAVSSFSANDYQENFNHFTEGGRWFDPGWSEVSVYDSPSGAVDLVVYHHNILRSEPLILRPQHREVAIREMLLI